MASLLDLNTDVLHIILSFLAQRSALNLAHTCKDAHTLAIPRALHRISVHPHRLPSLAMFVFDGDLKGQHRSSCIRSLEVKLDSSTRDGCFQWQAASASALVYVLANARGLRSLSLEAAETACTVHRMVTDAIAGLPQVTELSLQQLNCLSLSILPRMKNRHNISKLALSDFPTSLKDIRPLLGAVVEWSSMHTLELTSGHFSHEAVPCTPRLPSLHALAVRHGSVPISSLLDAAPSLRSLSLYGVTHFIEETRYWAYIDYVAATPRDFDELLCYSKPPRTGAAPRRHRRIRRIEVVLHHYAPTLHMLYSLLDLFAVAEPVVLTIPILPIVPATFFQKLAKMLPKLVFLELRLLVDDNPQGHPQHMFDNGWAEQAASNLGALRDLTGLHVCIVSQTKAAAAAYAGVAGRNLTLQWPSVFARHIVKLSVLGLSFESTGALDADSAGEGSPPSWFHVTDAKEAVIEGVESDGKVAQRMLHAIPPQGVDSVRNSLLDYQCKEYAQLHRCQA